ncbi:MAG: UDP-2,3-diacylglucosamine diphosphatase [Planctomycetota bacterium]
MTMRLKYRAIFISDLHLGSSGSRAADLASFLKRVDCEHLYLVGDVIDMWRLKQRWYWPEKHNRVIGRILKLAKRGTRVTFIPGNHDEHARQYAGLNFGGVEVKREASHLTADGRRLLITHGDQFDLVVKHARLLSVLGSWAYDTMVVFNTRLNWVRQKLGMNYWSLSNFLKAKVKKACTYIAQFEDTLIDEAGRRGFDGVVCGHIHKAEIRRGTPSHQRSVDYFNCGDWVESCTALVEHDDGTLQLIDGIAFVEQFREQRRELREALEGPPLPREARFREPSVIPTPASKGTDA